MTGVHRKNELAAAGWAAIAVIGPGRLIAEAIADYDHSIEIAPEYPDAYLNRGIAYEGKKLWKNAIADYNKL